MYLCEGNGMKFFIAGLILHLACFLTWGEDIRPYTNYEYTPPAKDDGELLVDFENNESPSEIAAFLSSIGVGRDSYSMFSQEERWVRIRNISEAFIDRIRGNSDVEGVEPNYYMSAFYVPNDPYYKHQWHLDLIGMRAAWDYPVGAPVTVAVIDTGIAYEEYQNNFRVEDLGKSQFVKPYNFVKGNTHANDDHGHGTHVAGTIAQLTNNGVGVAGIAPQVKLMPLKVLNSYGYGTIADIAAAIRYAADNGAKVINMSLGGPFPSFILHKACKYAHDKGVIIVCAAGNSGSARISYPAKYSECISVSAVRFDKQLTWYSSYGKGLTIAAPGGDLNVDQNGDGLLDGVLQNTLDLQDHSKQGYYLFQGTSMAAPHVAAAAALLVSHGVTSPDKVQQYLQNSAIPVPQGTPEQYGAGILNVQAALRAAYFYRNVKLLVFALAILAFLLGFLNHKRNQLEKVPFNLLSVLGLLFGTTGIFLAGQIPAARQVFLLAHPFELWPGWFFGPNAMNKPLILSALAPILFMLFLYRWKRMAAFTVAFAAGYSAFLLFQAFSPTVEVSWVPGRILEFLWMIFQAILCGGIAIIASFRFK
jgi:serine protease